MPPLEAAGGSNDPSGETFYAPPQMCLRMLEQLAFGLVSLGILLSVLRLEPRSVDQAREERLHVTHGRRRAHVAARAVHIRSESESDLGGRVGGKLPLGASDQRSEP